MYRLERKESIARPNILGNKSFPVHSCRWKDIAVCDDFDALKSYASNIGSEWRIIERDGGKVIAESRATA